jgi:hypothetical protein
MRLARLALLLVLAVGVVYWTERDASEGVRDALDPAGARMFSAPVDGRIIEVTGVVERLLPDDDDGSRHQRFIIRVEPDLTLLIVHNIDVAPRIGEIEIGDVVEVRGEYEWNAQGGLIHWTHHDPSGRHESGWVRHEGSEYR